MTHKIFASNQNVCAHLKISAHIKIFASNQNICAHLEISVHTQNICLHVKYLLTSKYPLTSKIFTTYLKYLRIYKIYAPHPKCSRLIIYDSNKVAVEIFAPYERCMRPENRRPNSYYLGSAESPTSDSFSVWLKSSRSGDVVSPPCSPQVGSAPRPPSLYGRRHTVPAVVPARPAKIFADIFTFFLGKIKNLTRLISLLSLQFKFVHNHKSCPNSAVTLLSP